jgi:hypothetical protein
MNNKKRTNLVTKDDLENSWQERNSDYVLLDDDSSFINEFLDINSEIDSEINSETNSETYSETNSETNLETNSETNSETKYQSNKRKKNDTIKNHFSISESENFLVCKTCKKEIKIDKTGTGNLWKHGERCSNKMLKLEKIKLPKEKIDKINYLFIKVKFNN